MHRRCLARRKSGRDWTSSLYQCHNLHQACIITKHISSVHSSRRDQFLDGWTVRTSTWEILAHPFCRLSLCYSRWFELLSVDLASSWASLLSFFRDKRVTTPLRSTKVTVGALISTNFALRDIRLEIYHFPEKQSMALLLALDLYLTRRVCWLLRCYRSSWTWMSLSWSSM